MIINFDSAYKIASGYAGAGEYILLALDRHPGVQVYAAKTRKKTTPQGLFPRTIELYSKGFHPRADFTIQFVTAPGFRKVSSDKIATVGWSMWEYKEFPLSWARAIWRIPINFVPCTYNRDVWLKANARKRRTYVVPLGIDPTIYYYQPQPSSEKFTFLISTTNYARKNPGMVYSVFRELFDDEKNVQLIMKSPGGHPGYEPTHNIQVISAVWGREQMANLMRQADCLVYPTMGEGFGLFPLEAMAVGTTTICTNWSGPVDYLDEKFSYKLRYSLTGKVKTVWGTFTCALPDREHLKELMWHVYTHQGEVRNKGKLAAEYVSKFTWDRTAQRIVDVLSPIYRRYNR